MMLDIILIIPLSLLRLIRILELFTMIMSL